MQNSYKNMSASAVVKTGFGKLAGMYVNSTSAGTIKFNDGPTGTASAGVKATGVFTASGAIADGEDVTIGSKTYTFVDEIDNSIPYQVLVGVSQAVTLDNLKLAVNADTGAGTLYSLGTDAHPDVTATTNTDSAQTVEAKVIDISTITSTDNYANASWGVGTLASGVNPNTLMHNTITPAVGYHNPGDVAFTRGLYATIGGTLDVTLHYV